MFLFPKPVISPITRQRKCSVSVWRRVVRMQRKIRDQVAGRPITKGTWGGRRRQNLTPQEEAEFLQSWIDKAAQGGVLVVPPIHAAFEKHLGRSIAASTVYRMLARHGWRKVEPDTCHPKRDVVAQEEFKKNSQKYWQKSCQTKYPEPAMTLHVSG